jgi:hypothetical protein
MAVFFFHGLLESETVQNDCFVFHGLLGILELLLGKSSVEEGNPIPWRDIRCCGHTAIIP